MPKVLTVEQRKESEIRRKESRRKAKEIERAKTQTYTIRVYHDSELEKAIEKAASDAGKQPGRYVRIAVIEKLQRDGYMAEISEEEPEEE